MLLSVESRCGKFGKFVGNRGQGRRRRRRRRRRRMSPRSETLLKNRLVVSGGGYGGLTERGRTDMYGADVVRIR
jgi:hypothetical protein